MPRKLSRPVDPARMTLRRLAELAGTTPATVSRALSGKPGISEKFRAKITALADERGYIPNQLARDMVSGSSTFVGFLASDLNNPFYVSVFRSLENLCRSCGLTLLIADSERDVALERQHLAQFSRMNVRGIILFPVVDWNADLHTDHWDSLVARRFPVVALGHLQMPGISTIISEEWQASAAIVGHLKKLGHRRFLVASGSSGANVPAKMRVGAILASVPEGDAALIDSDLPGWEQTVVERLTAAGDRPTAVIGISDHLALKLYRPLLRAGLRIPEDVSLVGFGSNVWAPDIYPSLSLSEPDSAEHARIAFSVLVEKIEDPATPDRHIVIPQTLRSRDSMAPPMKRRQVAGYSGRKVTE